MQNEHPSRRPESLVQIAVLSRMLLEALEGSGEPEVRESLLADLRDLHERSYALVSDQAVERATQHD